MASMASNVVPLGTYTYNRPPLSKDEYIAAIHGWIDDKQDAISRAELGAMRAFSRVDAQRKAYLIGICQYYRNNIRADVAPGVLAIITFLSDNEAGACTVGHAMMGQILGRSRTAIAEASSRLAKAGLIETSPKRALSSPIIPRVVTAGYNHLAWLIEALAEHVPSKGHDHVPSKGHQMSRRRDMLEPSCPVEPAKHVPSTGHNFTKENSSISGQEPEREEDKTTPSKVAASAEPDPSPPQAIDKGAPPAPEPQPGGRLSASDLDALQAALTAAAGESLADPASYPGLIVMSEPQRWLAQGCDLERDILPAIRACAARMPVRSIRNWGYFTQAVANAKATRLAPLPPADKPVPAHGSVATGNRRPPLRTFEQQRLDEERERNSRFLKSVKPPATPPRPVGWDQGGA